MIQIVEASDLAALEARLEALEAASPAQPGAASIISLADFGAVNNGSADMSAAWAAMIEASRLRGLPCVIPRGVYRFDARPALIDHCVNISGHGASNTGTMLVKNYATAPSDDLIGLLDFRPGSDGSSFGHVFMKNETPGGCLITAKASSTLTMTNLNLHDLNLSTSDTAALYHVIHFDGSAKVTGAKGCRLNSLRNVSVFGAQWASAVFKSCSGLWWHGGGVYPAGSTTPYSGALIVSGASDNFSAGIDIRIQTCGRLILDKLSGARIDLVSCAGVENTAEVSGVRGSGITGSVQANWSSSTWAA